MVENYPYYIIGEDPQEWYLETRKWRFIKLKEFNKNFNDEELLQKIEETYADFYYPEDMRHLIYYIPSKTFDPTKYTREQCLKRLVNLFKQFLDKEQNILSSKKYQ